MNTITQKATAAYAETFFNAIKMGRYMQEKVQALINDILTPEYQSKKQIFDQFASKFEGHTPSYILEELVNHGVIEKEVREEGIMRIPYEDNISFRDIRNLRFEDGVMKFKEFCDEITLELSTIFIGEPYNNSEYRHVKGMRVVPLRRAYYRLKEC